MDDLRITGSSYYPPRAFELGGKNPLGNEVFKSIKEFRDLIKSQDFNQLISHLETLKTYLENHKKEIIHQIKNNGWHDDHFEQAINSIDTYLQNPSDEAPLFQINETLSTLHSKLINQNLH